MRMMTKAEVCDYLKISFRTIEVWMDKGRFPRGVQIGKPVYWAEEAVHQWQAQMFRSQLDWKRKL